MISEVLWRFGLPWGSEKMGDGRNTDVRKDQAFTQRRWYKLSCCAGILNLSLRGSEFLSECEPSSWHRRACYPGSKGTTRQRRSGARVRATRRCRFSSSLLEFWSPGSKGTTGITCGAPFSEFPPDNPTGRVSVPRGTCPSMGRRLQTTIASLEHIAIVLGPIA